MATEPKLLVDFDPLLTCNGCGYNEIPSETLAKGRAVRDTNWRCEEWSAFRCFGCGKLRYVDECLKVKNVRLRSEPPTAETAWEEWGDDGEVS